MAKKVGWKTVETITHDETVDADFDVLIGCAFNYRADTTKFNRLGRIPMGKARMNADLQEVYDTERHLLYVACTRARDHLLVTSVAPASEFLDDLRG